MKHASYLAQKPLQGVTTHAEECLRKIREMLPKPATPQPDAEAIPEREPGSDDEIEAAW